MESESKFLRCLEELKLNFVVAIRTNHGVCYPKGKRFGAIDGESLTDFSDGTQEVRM